MRTTLQIQLPCGRLDPIGLGVFAERIQREVAPMINVYSDDQKFIEVMEIGSFDSEPPLTFRKNPYPLSPIFDYGLFDSYPGSNSDVKRAQGMSIDHFAAASARKLFKDLPITLSQDEPTMETVEEAAHKFMMENGADGNLIFIDANTTVIADISDFRLFLVDVLDNRYRQKVLHGVVRSLMPSRAIRIEHKNAIRLSGLVRGGV